MKYRRAKQTAWRAIAEETIVLDLAAKRMYGLNATAAFIWRTVETFESLAEMLQAMLASDGDSTLGVTDLEAFLQQLEDVELIERVEPEKRVPVALEPPVNVEAPRIEWQETVEQIAATCAFFPAQNPLCNQVPFS